MNLFVDDIGELLLPAPWPGPLEVVRGGAVLVVDGKVAFAGARAAAPALPSLCVRLSCEGRVVSPGLCDPHAHLVFAGERAHEFDLRNQGASYQEIQAAGGGILSTVRATRAASDAELVAGVRARLDALLAAGVTVAECKSGYDLTPDGELRLLSVIAQAATGHAVDVSPTLLLHVPDPARDRAADVHDFCERVIPLVAAQRLAEAVDIYCDQGAFTLDEARLVLEAARRAGLLLRAHAEQFTHTGVADLAASLGARSVEHLELLGAETPAALAAAGTVCNLLPGAALTLRLPWPDARRLYAAGCRVALGTDCNPGSSLTESQALMMSLATTQMRLSCAEAWLAVTREAAHACAREDAGHLRVGARGDLVVWAASDHRTIAQHLGANLVDSVAVRGVLQPRQGRRVA